MKPLAIFDCDGTLVDSQVDICRAMETAFAGLSLTPPPRTAIRRIVGLSVVEAAAVLLPDVDEAQHRDLADRYKKAFLKLRASGQVTESLYDGIKPLLESLVNDGWLLGVATGNSDRGLNRILDNHGLRCHFITLQTADRHPSKPNPSMIDQAMADAGATPLTTIMIGDTSYDINMGRAAGCRSVGVAWGYHPAEELLACGADFVAETVAELACHLKEQR
jgi:phosphoglycolate phosphatase